jgi:hypothetical protein
MSWLRACLTAPCCAGMGAIGGIVILCYVMVPLLPPVNCVEDRGSCEWTSRGYFMGKSDARTPQGCKSGDFKRTLLK